MALRFGAPRKPLTAFSTVGLTDIILLLLIFFLLSSSFIPAAGIPVNLPQSDASAPPDDEFVEVAISAEGRFYVGSRETPADSLELAMAAAKGGRTALVLRADEQATVGRFAEVAGAARRLGLRVLLATEEPQP